MKAAARRLVRLEGKTDGAVKRPKSVDPVTGEIVDVRAELFAYATDAEVSILAAALLGTCGEGDGVFAGRCAALPVAERGCLFVAIENIWHARRRTLRAIWGAGAHLQFTDYTRDFTEVDWVELVAMSAALEPSAAVLSYDEEGAL